MVCYKTEKYFHKCLEIILKKNEKNIHFIRRNFMDFVKFCRQVRQKKVPMGAVTKYQVSTCILAGLQ